MAEAEMERKIGLVQMGLDLMAYVAEQREALRKRNEDQWRTDLGLSCDEVEAAREYLGWLGEHENSRNKGSDKRALAGLYGVSVYGIGKAAKAIMLWEPGWWGQAQREQR